MSYIHTAQMCLLLKWEATSSPWFSWRSILQIMSEVHCPRYKIIFNSLTSISLSIYVSQPQNLSLCQECSNWVSSIQLGDTSNVFFIHKTGSGKNYCLGWTKTFESSCSTARCGNSIHIFEQRAREMCNCAIVQSVKAHHLSAPQLTSTFLNYSWYWYVPFCSFHGAIIV